MLELLDRAAALGLPHYPVVDPSPPLEGHALPGAWQWFDSGGWHPSARGTIPGGRVSPESAADLE